jgi:hypothetical protein
MATEQLIDMKVTAEERALIEALRAYGSNQTTEYLNMLATADKLIAVIEREDAPDKDENPNWREGVREAWIDVMTGNTRPIEDFWAELDNEACQRKSEQPRGLRGI